MNQNNSSLSGLLPGENNRHLRPSVTRTKYVDTFTRPTLPLKIYLEYAQCLIAAMFSAMFSQQQMDCCLLQQVEMLSLIRQKIFSQSAANKGSRSLHRIIKVKLL